MSLTGKDLQAKIKKHPVAFASLLLSLVLVAGLFYRRADLPAKEEELAQKSAEGERLKTNIQYNAQLQEQYEAVAAANREIEAQAIHVGSLATNLQYFYKIEADTGVRLLDLRQMTPPSRGTGAAATKYLRVPYTLSAQGRFPEIISFLRQVESGPHFTRINNASLSGSATLTLALGIEVLGLP